MKNEEWRPLTSRGRPESIMHDMMLSSPPRLRGYIVQDPIQNTGKNHLFPFSRKFKKSGKLPTLMSVQYTQKVLSFYCIFHLNSILEKNVSMAIIRVDNFPDFLNFRENGKTGKRWFFPGNSRFFPVCSEFSNIKDSRKICPRKTGPPENSPGKFALHRVFQIFHIKY